MTDWYPQSAQPAGGPPAADPSGQAPPGGYPAPPGGYPVPPHLQPSYPGAVVPTYVDPLISPDYAGWWRRGLDIAKRGWKPLALLQIAALVLAVVVQAPLAAYTALATQRMERVLADTPSDPFTTVLGVLGLALAGLLLSVIVAGIVTIATVHVGVSVATGAPVRIGEALQLAVRRVFPLLGWQLLAVPIYLVALCLCVLPVLYVAAVFLVLPVVVAIERTNAISRCFSLFHRDSGVAIGRVATIFGLSIGAAVVGGLIGAGLEAAGRAAVPGDGGVIAGSVGSTFVTAIVMSVMAILVAPLTLTAYADMRARQGPLDATVIARELGIVPALLPPPPMPWPPGPPTNAPPSPPQDPPTYPPPTPPSVRPPGWDNA